MNSKRFAVLFVALLMFGAAVASFAAKGGVQGQAFAVSFSFRDAQTDRIQSEVPGSNQPYQGTIKITSDNLALQMIHNGGGTVSLDFSACAVEPCTRNPFDESSGTSGTTVISFSVSECQSTPLHQMSPSDNQLCAFKPNPADPEGNDGWRLRFDPSPFLGGGGEGEEAGGTRVLVTCTGGTEGQCAAWTLEAADTDIGSLLRVNTKGRLMETWVGSYSMPFRMTVTKQ